MTTEQKIIIEGLSLLYPKDKSLKGEVELLENDKPVVAVFENGYLRLAPFAKGARYRLSLRGDDGESEFLTDEWTAPEDSPLQFARASARIREEEVEVSWTHEYSESLPSEIKIYCPDDDRYEFEDLYGGNLGGKASAPLQDDRAGPFTVEFHFEQHIFRTTAEAIPRHALPVWKAIDLKTHLEDGDIVVVTWDYNRRGIAPSEVFVADFEVKEQEARRGFERAGEYGPFPVVVVGSDGNRSMYLAPKIKIERDLPVFNVFNEEWQEGMFKHGGRNLISVGSVVAIPGKIRDEFGRHYMHIVWSAKDDHPEVEVNVFDNFSESLLDTFTITKGVHKRSYLVFGWDLTVVAGDLQDKTKEIGSYFHTFRFCSRSFSLNIELGKKNMDVFPDRFQVVPGRRLLFDEEQRKFLVGENELVRSYPPFRHLFMTFPVVDEGDPFYILIPDNPVFEKVI